MPELKKILVPVDGSEPSTRALAHAALLAKATGAALDLVTVVDLRQIDIYEGFYLTDDQLGHIEAQAREKILAEAAKQVDDLPVTTHLLKGAVSELLLDHAAKCDLVVVGRTGKNVLERFLEGSTSRALALHSTVPVTIVP